VVRGIDIIDVLLRAPGGFRFLFVVIDTLTKWMEATPVVNIIQEAAVKFLQSIIYRFGVPQRVLTDNGTQFKGVKFLRCCETLEYFINRHQRHIRRQMDKLSAPMNYLFKV
jgi:transposase InsO family protein